MPKKLREVSEPERERSKRRTRENSPRSTRDELHDPGGDMIVPDDPSTYQEGPTGRTSEDGGETSALDRDTRPGGCRGEQVESRGVKGDWSHQTVADSAEIDGIGPGNERNERGGDADPPSRDRDPGGHSGRRVELRVVEGGSGRHKVVDRAEYDWIRPRIDGNKRVVETNASSRDTGPGGRLGERDGLGDVEDDRERQSDGDRVETEIGRAHV